MHKFLKLIFGIKLYMFRTVPLSTIRNFFTVHTAMVHVIQLASSRIRTELQFRPDPAACKLSANLYDIYHCCAYSEKNPDGWKRNCPKHVEFYSKNKFLKLWHLVRSSMRIYHEAQSPERQMLVLSYSACVWDHTTCLDMNVLSVHPVPNMEARRP